MVKFKGILFSFILAFGIVASRSIPSSASAYVIDPSTIGSIGDLGLGLLGGAEFDFTGSKYQIENYDSLSQADQVDAAIGATNQFIEDYWSARKEYIKANNGFLQETYKVYDNYALKNAGLLNTDTNFHISGQLATDWMQYSKYWYKDYVTSLTLEDDIIVPTPDINYVSYIELINGTDLSGSNYGKDFFWSNRPTSVTNQYSLINASWFDYSYVSFNWLTRGSTDDNSKIVRYTSNTTYRADFMFCNPITFNINSSNGSYSVSTSIRSVPGAIKQNYQIHDLSIIKNNNTFSSASIMYINSYSRTFTYTNTTLSSILNNISKFFRNVTIYVDDVLWALAGQPDILNPVIPEFPDIIGTDNDPIYTFDLPDTSNFEGAFDITSLFDAIKEAIIGASDTDNTTSGVLTGESVSDLVVDDTGTLVGTKAVPISTVLDDSIEGEATKRLPNIELYPDKIHDAFSGTSLLADVILAIQQSLPSTIVVVFWGIVICLIIIALIKSLHR